MGHLRQQYSKCNYAIGVMHSCKLSEVPILRYLKAERNKVHDAFSFAVYTNNTPCYV